MKNITKRNQCMSSIIAAKLMSKNGASKIKRNFLLLGL
jgi:hypothetical protein